MMARRKVVILESKTVPQEHRGKIYPGQLGVIMPEFIAAILDLDQGSPLIVQFDI
jgi:hypothetical protein